MEIILLSHCELFHPWIEHPMNIKGWQRAKEEQKRSPQKGSSVQATHDPPRVQAKLEVLEAELAAIAAKPPQDDGTPDRKPNS